MPRRQQTPQANNESLENERLTNVAATSAPEANAHVESSAGFARRWGSNLGAIIGRNLASVAIPTAARELFRRGGFGAMIDSAGPAVSTGVATLAGLAPIVYQSAGMYRDYQNGTMTMVNAGARIFNIAAVGSAYAAAAATGTLPQVASAMAAANLVYTPLRDLVQYNLQLTDNNASIDGTRQLGATATAATLYGVNQTLVSHGMDSLSTSLSPYLGDVGGHVIGRATMNLIGETADELVSRGATNVAGGGENPLEVHMHPRAAEDRSWSAVADQLTDTHAGRSSLFSTTYNSVYASKLEGWGSDAVVGATLGLSYIPFVYAHAKKQQVPTYSNDIELGTLTPLITDTPPSASVLNTTDESINNKIDLAQVQNNSLAESKAAPPLMQGDVSDTTSKVSQSTNGDVQLAKQYDDAAYSMGNNRAIRSVYASFEVPSSSAADHNNAGISVARGASQNLEQTRADSIVKNPTESSVSSASYGHRFPTQERAASNDFIAIEKPENRQYNHAHFSQRASKPAALERSMSI